MVMHVHKNRQVITDLNRKMQVLAAAYDGPEFNLQRNERSATSQRFNQVRTLANKYHSKYLTVTPPANFLQHSNK